MAHKYLIFFIGLLITHKDENFAQKKMHSNWMKTAVMVFRFTWIAIKPVQDEAFVNLL
jgi:hypothetical protein